MSKIVGILLYVVTTVLFAVDMRFVPTAATQVNWMFAGEVVTESAERYRYVFQLQRDEAKFHVVAALFDPQTQKVLLHAESSAILNASSDYNWQIGKNFLRFNAINASWVFGMRQDDNHGFNFKVDMLNPGQNKEVTQVLRKGIVFSLIQTGPLDGHISLPTQQQSQFVSNTNTWFRQTFADHVNNNGLQAVLCQFNDGSSLYSMNIHEADALRASVAGMFDAEGVALNVSQFISTTQATDGQWHIRVASPAMDLALNNDIEDQTIIGGFIGNLPTSSGFCLLNSAMLQHTPFTVAEHVAQNVNFFSPLVRLFARG